MRFNHDLIPSHEGNLEDEVQIIRRTPGKRMHFVRFDRKGIAGVQGDRVSVDDHRTRSVCDQINLMHLRVVVRFVDALIGKADGNRNG